MKENWLKREVRIDMSHLMTVDDPMGFITHVLKENLDILRDVMTRECSACVNLFKITIPERFAATVMATRVEFLNAIRDRLSVYKKVNEQISYEIICNAGDIITIEAVGYEGLKPTNAWFKYYNADVLYATNLYERMKQMEEERFVRKKLQIKEVKFNGPATIVFWTDGTKTVVKCQDETFDPEKGIAMAIVKKVYGNEGKYYNKIRKALNESTGREIK